MDDDYMNYEKELLKAHKKYEEKKYEEAVLIYDNLFCKISNPTINLIKEYAICLQKRLRYEESLKLTDIVLLKNPNDADMLLNYCICLGKQNKHAEALELYERILKFNEKYRIQIGYYAYLLGRTGNYEKADYYYKIALEYESQNLWYISHYAFFLQKLKRYREAEMYYKKAIKNDSNNSWLIKRYAFFIYEMSGKDSAYLYYKDLITRDLSNYNYYINAAELAIISNDKDIAFRFLCKTDKLDKPLVIEIILLFYWGVYFICKKEYEKLNDSIKEMSLLRKNYTSYIDRDLTDLEEYVNNNFDKFQRKLYITIFNIMSTGVK